MSANSYIFLINSKPKPKGLIDVGYASTKR